MTLARGEFDRSLNHSLIYLIPKVDIPDSIKQIRPITLCNVLVKVVTKVLANRIKPHVVFLPNIVVFVLGRQTTDNIVISQEALHSM